MAGTDPLRWPIRVVDALVLLGLFVAAACYRLPLVPHFEISSDSVDPFVHAYRIVRGLVPAFSADSPLYSYGRAWSYLPLVAGADGLRGVIVGRALLSSCIPPLVYLAGRILTSGRCPGPLGREVPRAGALLGPLLGASLLVRLPTFLGAMVSGSHTYLAPEWGALLVVGLALLLRAAGLGGGESDVPPRPASLAVWAVAGGCGVALAMMPLNHPYGAMALGIAVPVLGVLLVRTRRAVGPVLLLVAVATLLAFPHANHLVWARGEMADGLIAFARSDSEFAQLSWRQATHRMLVGRTTDPQSLVLTWSLLGSPLLAAGTWGRRPRLAGASLVLGLGSLATLVIAVGLGRLCRHVQPYHWLPLVPLLATGLGVALTCGVDAVFRRSRPERGRDAERGNSLLSTGLRRTPAALVMLGICLRVGLAIGLGFSASRGFYEEELESMSRVRQLQHHERVVGRLLAEEGRTGELPASVAIDLPEYSVVLDQVTIALDLLLRGRPPSELNESGGDPFDRALLLHVGLGSHDPETFLRALPSGWRLVEGNEEFLVFSGRTAAAREFSRRLCGPLSAPRRLRDPGAQEPYRLRGGAEAAHLLGPHRRPTGLHDWAHPCLAELAWVDVEGGEVPTTAGGVPPFEDVPPDRYAWFPFPRLFAARLETTRADWGRCVQAGACPSGPERGPPEEPAVGMDAASAAGFCLWLLPPAELDGRRFVGDLPTDLEWEGLATWRRGISERRAMTPGPELTPAQRGNLAGSEDGFGGLAVVGSFPRGRSETGLEDLFGNAAEWVRAARRPGQESDGPLGVALGPMRVAGGSFRTPPGDAGPGRYEDVDAAVGRDDVGLRCVARSAPREPPAAIMSPTP